MGGGQLYLVSDFQGRTVMIKNQILWVSREAVVSNKDVEKFDIPHFMHSHTIFLPDDLFRMLYIVEDML